MILRTGVADDGLSKTLQHSAQILNIPILAARGYDRTARLAESGRINANDELLEVPAMVLSTELAWLNQVENGHRIHEEWLEKLGSITSLHSQQYAI